MSFTSLPFFIFIIATLILYFTIPKKYQWAVLLTASYVFYMSSGIKIVAFLLVTTVSTFGAGILLDKVNEEREKKVKELGKNPKPEEKKALVTECKKRKKGIVAGALLINFGILAFLKYYNFLAGNLNAASELWNGNWNLPQFSLLLPLGLSFYIFQSLGYVIDVYRGKYKADRNLGQFALFVSFFPQIIQGPISRYDQLAHQLYEEHNLDFDRLKYGIQLMLWGYFKKVLIADRASVLVASVFDHYMDYPGSIAAVGVFFYCIQIYCDFSGGIDITRGIAQAMGIDMIENFQRPYFATSLGDFWRRWHISLGSWMRDYLFYPLSLSKPFARMGKKARKKLKGNLGKILPTSLATFIVFLAIGVWHGANWKYIVFGLWNGTIITFSLICAPVYTKILQSLKIDPNTKWWKAFQILRTTLLVFIGRYFTRAADCTTAWDMLHRTFTYFHGAALTDGTVATLGLASVDFWLIFLFGFLVLLVGYFQERGIKIRKTLEEKSPWVQGLVIFALVAALVVFGVYREGYIASEFIYKQY